MKVFSTWVPLATSQTLWQS
ncbi:hypothetical protein E2I00_014858 [Balaenoptera physalus]|uniref:Uncharacterized protein n=1 Tax=Balaenoptera physalus TaxID=9770 RepID=A0A6A1QKS5_BALPH|nr:hypothetical protein E2I00_014858 [Balaenoptera physalus]